MSVTPLVIDLSLAKTVSAEPYTVGYPVTFTIVVTNDGPSDATGVNVTDVVPVGYSNVSNISGSSSLVGSTIVWSSLNIPSGTAVTLTFDADIEASGSYVNVAEVTAADQTDKDSTPKNNDPAEDDQDSAEIDTPQLPTLTIEAEPNCTDDIAWLNYDITANGFTPQNGATIEWIDGAGVVRETLTGQPLIGKLLWYGMVLDAGGNPIEWTGWDTVGSGWVKKADFDLLRPEMTVRITVNPTQSVVVTYPPATSVCSPNPPKTFPWPLFMAAIIPPQCPDEPLYCYMVSDRDNETSEEEGSTNSALLKYTFTENSLELVGRLGVGSVEAMTLSLDGTTLYAVDSNMFGTIDTTPGNTSSFTPINPSGLGIGNGSRGLVNFTDIDGISFDPSTGILYGTNRLATSDLLLQINPATGTFVEDAFGLGVDYMIIASNAEGADWYDLDDIGIDKNGTMYGIANAQGLDDRMVIIDKQTGDIADPVLLVVDGEPINDMEGFSYFGQDTFYGTTGIETTAGQGDYKNSLFKIETNPVRVEKIISLDQDFNGYIPYDFESVACRMCVQGKRNQ